MPTISDIRECLICNEIGEKYKRKFSLHIKVDTGMSRLGFEIDDFESCFQEISLLRHIEIDGIYSHLASADANNSLDKNSFANIQKDRFQKVLNRISIKEYPCVKIHLANSAGTFLGEDFHFDMVRVGLAMYGYQHLIFKNNLNLKPALFLKSKVSFIRTIDTNVGVSYGKQFVSNKKTKLAVISIGYADGICRKLSNQISLIHNGNIYPQVGAITMDQLMIDVTNSDEIKIGDPVILLGADRDKYLSPLEWADKASTIPWEILCAFKNRLPRVQIL